MKKSELKAKHNLRGDLEASDMMRVIASNINDMLETRFLSAARLKEIRTFALDACSVLRNEELSASHAFNVGDRINYNSNGSELQAKIVGRGEECGKPVYDLNTGHWCYEEQIISFEIKNS